MKDLVRQLQEPFPADEVEWRVQRSGIASNGPWAMVLAYVANRAIQNRLDDLFGVFGWRNEFKPAPEGGILCGISIQDSNGEWITKWDGAEQTVVEAVKGGLSSSMKRAAVQWGIGRYLYDLPVTFAHCSSAKAPAFKNKAKAPDGSWFYWQTPQLPEWALPDKGA
jgi:hypothetical protein